MTINYKEKINSLLSFLPLFVYFVFMVVCYLVLIRPWNFCPPPLINHTMSDKYLSGDLDGFVFIIQIIFT